MIQALLAIAAVLAVITSIIAAMWLDIRMKIQAPPIFFLLGFVGMFIAALFLIAFCGGFSR